MELKAVVIGCGDLGGMHANAWGARPDAKLVGVCDPDRARSDALAKRVGAEAFTNYREAIQAEGVNVVSVATPTFLHPEIAIFAMEQGCHVLCEKPIALTLEEADGMIEAAKANDVLLAISFQRRTFPLSIRARALRESGAFGGPIHACVASAAEVRPKTAMNRKSMNGGPVIDVTCHHVDVMRFITGADPVRVFAAGGIFGKGKERTAPFTDDLAVDAVAMTVEYEGGHVLSQYTNWGMPEGFPNWAVADVYQGPNLRVQQGPEGPEAIFPDHKEVYTGDPANPAGPPLRIENLVRAIRGEEELTGTGEDGKMALRVSLAALESVETGKAIAL